MMNSHKQIEICVHRLQDIFTDGRHPLIPSNTELEAWRDIANILDYHLWPSKNRKSPGQIVTPFLNYIKSTYVKLYNSQQFQLNATNGLKTRVADLIMRIEGYPNSAIEHGQPSRLDLRFHMLNGGSVVPMRW